MNRTIALSLAIVLVAAGNAFADDITNDPHPFTSTASRAEVQEDLRLFRMAGNSPWADDYNPLAQFHGTLTRAEVTADYMGSRESVSAFTAEDSGSAYLARTSIPGSGRDTILAGTD
ncbi:DUF4148 domain-containing protein [Ramlibacter sp. PS3R-8]|uniref:DUF4148 domain-containing protein n=1 Tax=Ramlibacter sp. PS3R-8 TaxID=3133437 RepID=UPI0030A8124A